MKKEFIENYIFEKEKDKAFENSEKFCKEMKKKYKLTYIIE